MLRKQHKIATNCWTVSETVFLQRFSGGQSWRDVTHESMTRTEGVITQQKFCFFQFCFKWKKKKGGWIWIDLSKPFTLPLPSINDYILLLLHGPAAFQEHLSKNLGCDLYWRTVCRASKLQHQYRLVIPRSLMFFVKPWKWIF